MKILCLFDYVARTGFGTVSKNIVHELKKHFGENLKLHIIAINYFGESFWEDDNTYVESAKLNDGEKDDFGRFLFLKTLSDLDFDGIFICQDIGIVTPFIEHLEYIKKLKKENNRKNFKSIFYFPIDCNVFPSLTEKLGFFDVMATYTEFARNEVVKHRPDLKGKIRVIPHGNSSKDFYPLSQEEKSNFRKEYFGEENAKKFIILNVNRNQPRKDLPSTILGFQEAVRLWDNNLPEPFLYLHCHPLDPLGWDLRLILSQTDLVEGKDYMLLPEEYQHSMVENDMLNKIYNACDCFITTTTGEGWGLTYSEAAAAKIPIVAPYSTSFVEMSNNGKGAYMLYTLYPICQQIDSIIREQVDINEVAEILEQVAIHKHDNNKELNQKIETNYNWVTSLEWNLVCKKWVECFKEVF